MALVCDHAASQPSRSEAINWALLPLKCPLSIGTLKSSKTAPIFSNHGYQRENMVFFNIRFCSFCLFYRRRLLRIKRNLLLVIEFRAICLYFFFHWHLVAVGQFSSLSLPCTQIAHARFWRDGSQSYHFSSTGWATKNYTLLFFAVT